MDGLLIGSGAHYEARRRLAATRGPDLSREKIGPADFMIERRPCKESQDDAPGTGSARRGDRTA